MTLEPWVGYIVSPGALNPATTLQLSTAPPAPQPCWWATTFTRRSWTDYFIGRRRQLPPAGPSNSARAQIYGRRACSYGAEYPLQERRGLNDSSLLLAGKVTGSTTIGIAGTSQRASLWVTKDNSQSGSGPTINYMGASGAVHFIDGSNLGLGRMVINNGGTLASTPPTPRLSNTPTRRSKSSVAQFRRGPQLSEQSAKHLLGRHGCV